MDERRRSDGEAVSLSFWGPTVNRFTSNLKDSFIITFLTTYKKCGQVEGDQGECRWIPFPESLDGYMESTTLSGSPP